MAAMSTRQSNPDTYNPNNIDLVSVATYQRRVATPLIRVWENVRDWAHLPHLHDSSFNYVELDESSQWGWRTWSDAAHSGHVELVIVDESRYVARTYQGEQQISEIWTHLKADGESTLVDVEFYLPDVSPADTPKMGEFMLKLYTRLWDEDETMMRERHRRLNETRSDTEQVDLGVVTALRQQLQAGEPVTFALRRKEYRAVEKDGQITAQPTICPHLLGPLRAADDDTDILFCPWHGYRFDSATGHCVSHKNATCRLPATPTISIEDSRVIARLK